MKVYIKDVNILCVIMNSFSFSFKFECVTDLELVVQFYKIIPTIFLYIFHIH